jgi:hypothetical protein
MVQRTVGNGGDRPLSSDVSPEVPEVSEQGVIRILLIQVDHQEQIGDQAGQELHQQTLGAPGDQVIDIEMAFPPREKCFECVANLRFFSIVRRESEKVVALRHIGLYLINHSLSSCKITG